MTSLVHYIIVENQQSMYVAINGILSLYFRIFCIHVLDNIPSMSWPNDIIPEILSYMNIFVISIWDEIYHLITVH